MNGNLVVGAIVIAVVAASLAYLVWQRRRGRCSCGMDCGCRKPAGKDDGETCDCCRDKD